MSVNESLHTREHPGILFRSGPTGRRAALFGGPDVWEVITALNAIRDETPDLDGEPLVVELTEATGLSREQVSIALRYYTAYPAEVDRRIASNRDVTEREERLWADG
jgi:hypothetical protein